MNKDIQDIFKEKNKEILITNLKYDLDKNIGSLFETITNIFNLEFETAIKKISIILDDANLNDYNNKVSSIISDIRINNYKNIDGLIQNKKKILINKIEIIEFEENKMTEYYETVLVTTKNIKKVIEKDFLESISYVNRSLKNYIVDNSILDNNLLFSRLDDYLDRLYEKIITKLHMEIMIRDNNLINKAKEVYLRYQDICSKTE